MTNIPKDAVMQQIEEYKRTASNVFDKAREPMKDLQEVNYQLGRIRAYQELAQWIETNF